MTATTSPVLTIVGLGPGDASLLTIEAHQTLASADEVWLRTSRHPTVAALPQGPRYESFDDLYESGGSFEEVYDSIIARVLELAARPAGAVYAVPGHPLFGEATVRALLDRVGERGGAVQVVAGVSFLDAAANALRLDPLADGLVLLDALAFAPHRRVLVPERPTIIAQVYDRRAASQVKLALLEAYPPEHQVAVLRGAGTSDESVTSAAVAELDRSDGFDHLTLVYVPPLGLLEDVRSFEGLRAVVAKLRAPEGGCPWDLEQTHETLRRYLIEETYEALDALDEGEPKRLAEEFGDLMMQVLLHAQIAEDEGEFTIEDVMASIASKLIRRHPHVFGDVQVEGAQEVLRNWETLKKQERSEGGSLLDHVPRALPALAQAQSLYSRASKARLAPESMSEREVIESVGALVDPAASLTAERLGALLLAIVALATDRDLNAEDALRLALGRYRAQVAANEGAR